MNRPHVTPSPHGAFLCIDGVYVEEGSDLRFVPAPAPTQAKLLPVLERLVCDPSYSPPPHADKASIPCVVARHDGALAPRIKCATP